MKPEVIWILAICAIGQLYYAHVQIWAAKKMQSQGLFKLKWNLYWRVREFWGQSLEEINSTTKTDKRYKKDQAIYLEEFKEDNAGLNEHDLTHIRLKCYQYEKDKLKTQVKFLFGREAYRFLEEIPTYYEWQFCKKNNIGYEKIYTKAFYVWLPDFPDYPRSEGISAEKDFNKLLTEGYKIYTGNRLGSLKKIELPAIYFLEDLEFMENYLHTVDEPDHYNRLQTWAYRKTRPFKIRLRKLFNKIYIIYRVVRKIYNKI